MSASKAHKPTHGGYPGTVPTPPTLRSKLEAALAFVNAPDKWTQGQLLDPNGCMCMLGAIAKNNGIKPLSEGWEMYLIGQLPESRALAAAIKGFKYDSPSVSGDSVIYELNDTDFGSTGTTARHQGPETKAATHAAFMEAMGKAIAKVKD